MGSVGGQHIQLIKNEMNYHVIHLTVNFFCLFCSELVQHVFIVNICNRYKATNRLFDIFFKDFLQTEILKGLKIL